MAPVNKPTKKPAPVARAVSRKAADQVQPETEEDEALEDQAEEETAEDEQDSADQGDAQEEADADQAEGDASTDEADDPGAPAAEPGQKPASEAPSKPHQAGFAQRVGRTSTKPAKMAAMPRPYLESPRDFGIHVDGHLLRFKKGRTPITDAYFKAHDLTAARVLEALKADSYVEDNGAELVE